MLALRQPRGCNANGVVWHFKKLGALVVSKVAATVAFIHKLAIAKDDPTFATSIIEITFKVIGLIIE